MKTSNHKFCHHGLPLVDEAKFQLFINGMYYSDFLCTPENIEELVIGYLYTDCHILALCELEELSINDYRVDAYIKPSEGPATFERRKQYIKLPANDKLRELAIKMFNSAAIYKKCGGIHCSAFTDGERLLAFKEDIGRHNAFDKVVGEALLKGLDPSKMMYLTSGRVNHEVMQKALSCRISVVISRSICSSAAYKTACDNSIMVIGRILEDNPVVYGNMEALELKGDN